MLGSILGDYLGSTFEKIPNYELRIEKTITDDSYLTLAGKDWISNIDLNTFVYLFNNQDKYETEFLDYQEKIKTEAIDILKKWYYISIKYEQSVSTKSNIPTFSLNFSKWVDNHNIKKQSNSNGCLMRNSFIVYHCFENKLSLDQILLLTKIFAQTTHDNTEALKSIYNHTIFLYLCLLQVINKDNKNDWLNHNSTHIGHITEINIQPLSYWQNNTKIIWDSMNSLNIALSSIYYSNSYSEVIDFCNNTHMDTDTYCAIAGGIAETIFGIDSIFKSDIFKVSKQISLLTSNSQ